MSNYTLLLCHQLALASNQYSTLMSNTLCKYLFTARNFDIVKAEEMLRAVSIPPSPLPPTQFSEACLYLSTKQL